MKIVLTPFQWNELNADGEYEFVRSAFYLGMNYAYIQDRCKARAHSEERLTVIDTAEQFGIRESDVIIKGRVG